MYAARDLLEGFIYTAGSKHNCRKCLGLAVRFFSLASRSCSGDSAEIHTTVFYASIRTPIGLR